jgi:hypothetical protein
MNAVMPDTDALMDCVVAMCFDEWKAAGLPTPSTDQIAVLTDLTLRHVVRVGAGDAREVLRRFLSVEV